MYLQKGIILTCIHVQ